MSALDDLLVVHTSDLHIGDDVHGDDPSDPRSLRFLRWVLEAARG